jgi:hypothetical protein
MRRWPCTISLNRRAGREAAAAQPRENYAQGSLALEEFNQRPGLGGVQSAPRCRVRGNQAGPAKGARPRPSARRRIFGTAAGHSCRSTRPPHSGVHRQRGKRHVGNREEVPAPRPSHRQRRDRLDVMRLSEQLQRRRVDTDSSAHGQVFVSLRPTALNQRTEPEIMHSPAHGTASAIQRADSALGFWGMGWLLRTFRDRPSLKPDARCLGLMCFDGDRSTGDWVSAAPVCLRPGRRHAPVWVSRPARCGAGSHPARPVAVPLRWHTAGRNSPAGSHREPSG